MTKPAKADSASALTAKQRQGVESRERILDAAMDLIFEQGYSGTSLSALSARAGLPASSIYWHFGSKDGVIAAVVSREAERFFATVPDAAALPGDPVEQFSALMLQLADVVQDDARFFRVLVTLAMETTDVGSEATAVVRQVRERGLEIIAGPITRLCAALSSDRDPRELAAFCLAGLEGATIGRRFGSDLIAPRAMLGQLAIAVVAIARTPVSVGPAEDRPDGATAHL